MGRDGRRPVRRWLVVLAWVAGTVTLLLGGGLLWLWLQLSGGLPVRGTRPDDDRVVAAREAWQPAWDARQAGFVAVLEESGLVLLAVNTSDTCRVGQNNWKVQDGYGLRCTFTHRVVLGAQTADLTELVTDVHEAVTAGDLDGAPGPDRSRTLLTELARHEPHHDRVDAGSYRGHLTVDGGRSPVWSSVGLAREPTTYSLDTVLWAPEPVHAMTGRPLGAGAGAGGTGVAGRRARGLGSARGLRALGGAGPVAGDRHHPDALLHPLTWLVHPSTRSRRPLSLGVLLGVPGPPRPCSVDDEHVDPGRESS